jgi:hypothetical protein
VACIGARFDVSGCTAARHRRVDLHNHGVDGVRERDRLGTTASVRRVLDALAEAMQEILNGAFLGALGIVVVDPVLGVGLAGHGDGLGNDLRAISSSLDGLRGLEELDGPLMLAAAAA